MSDKVKNDPHKKMDCNDEYAKSRFVQLVGSLSTFIDLAAALEYLEQHKVDLMDAIDCKDVIIALQVAREDLKKMIDEEVKKSRLS